MNDNNNFVEQEAITIQEIFDVATGETLRATSDAELVLLDPATGAKRFLHRIPQLRTADGIITNITDSLVCRSCNTIISQQASVRCTRCRATTCVSCAGPLQECTACQKQLWWPRFWQWLCSV